MEKINIKKIGKIIFIIGILAFVIGIILILFAPSEVAMWIIGFSVIANIIGISMLTFKV